MYVGDYPVADGVWREDVLAIMRTGLRENADKLARPAERAEA